jgi:hypothetical protein
MNCHSQLPVGVTGFEQLRTSNQIYVDKTRAIAQLARQKYVCYFLARPRRFGKTLLLSTFASLFSHGLEYFQDLEIAKEWDDRTYPVVSLDFSVLNDCSDTDSFLVHFIQYVSQRFAPLGFTSQNRDIVGFCIDFNLWLSGRTSQIVLLIDEYDAPLTLRLNDPGAFKEISRCLSSFYRALKSSAQNIRFLFITGITKFQKTTIFSGLNNVVDISLLPEYSTLLGYTDEEIRKYFGCYLEEAGKKLGCSSDEIFINLKKYYNGYCFDPVELKTVFVPWSSLLFLASPQAGFVNYWYGSAGAPQVLREFIKFHTLENPENYAKERTVPLDSLRIPTTLDLLDSDVLLTQTGYLTIKKVDGNTAYLGYPNLEISESMAKLYGESMLTKAGYNRVGSGILKQSLANNNLAEFVREVNRAFLSIDYKDNPVKDEASCRAILQILLINSQLDPIPELHHALGRSDLEFDVGNAHWVFELKYAKSNTEAANLLEKGAEQIRAHRYGEQFRATSLNRVVLVYSKETASFIFFRQVD